jgi:uncharacterized protein YjiS (DUF1127 family)
MTTTLFSLLQSMTAYGYARLTARRAATLRDLDARTLADIGVDASEIASIEAEWRGSSAPTRLRIATRPCHA